MLMVVSDASILASCAWVAIADAAPASAPTLATAPPTCVMRATCEIFPLVSRVSPRI